MSVIAVIIGSTRKNRFAEKPAQWILRQVQERRNVDGRLLDLLHYPMPFFDEPFPPAMPGRPPYEHPVVKEWTAQIAAADGYIVVSGEYNHGYPAALKNALDYVYQEWHRKPVAFVSYGGNGGTRGVEQLRQVAVELQMAPLRNAVHIPLPVLMAHFQGRDVAPGLEELNPQSKLLIDDLLWWAEALKAARG